MTTAGGWWQPHIWKANRMTINECEIWARGTAEQLDVVHQRVAAMGELKQPAVRVPLHGERGRFSVYYRVTVTSSAPPANVPVRKTRRKPTD